jgi:hypothetical protein
MNSETANTTATEAAPGAQGAPEKAPSAKGASRKKTAPRGQRSAKVAKKAAAKKGPASKTKPASAKKATTPQPASKGAKILALIGRPKGATLAELQRATEWQAHSVRGFLSTAAKKHSLKIRSSNNEAGERSYSIGK